ncbi:MAG: cytoplasmic protein [Candidatus Rokuibacteriota bacterium]|nr:MAG: cytoplasmic protein [Candidatus Rokubacteria bacterium]
MGVKSVVMRPRDSFQEFEATSIFCPRCRRATPARQKLLLVLPDGNKYDYVCAECGTAVGGKTDNDPTNFHSTVPPPRLPRR